MWFHTTPLPLFFSYLNLFNCIIKIKRTYEVVYNAYLTFLCGLVIGGYFNPVNELTQNGLTFLLSFGGILINSLVQ